MRRMKISLNVLTTRGNSIVGILPILPVVVKERHIILSATRQLHPVRKSSCLANRRDRPPTLNLETTRGVKAGF